MLSQDYLYVDDDRLSRAIMKMVMEDVIKVSSYVIFESSEDFLSRIKALDPMPKVFLLDIHVEPYSGFEMLEMLRNDPTFSECQIIALTASVMNEEVAKLRDAGFDGAISKPLDIETISVLFEQIQQGESVWHIA